MMMAAYASCCSSVQSSAALLLNSRHQKKDEYKEFVKRESGLDFGSRYGPPTNLTSDRGRGRQLSLTLYCSDSHNRAEFSQIKVWK